MEYANYGDVFVTSFNDYKGSYKARLLGNSFCCLLSDLIVVLNYVAYFERKKYEIERWSVRKITGKVEHYRSLMMPNRLLPFPIQIAIAIYFLTRDNWIVC